MAKWLPFPSPKFPNDPWNMPRFGQRVQIGKVENDPNPVDGVYIYPDYGDTFFVTPDQSQQHIDIKQGFWAPFESTEHTVHYIHR